MRYIYRDIKPAFQGRPRTGAPLFPLSLPRSLAGSSPAFLRNDLRVNAIARSDVLTCEVWAERLASGFELLPVGQVGQRRNGDELALIQTCQRRVDHLLRGHDHLAGEVVDGKVCAIPELRRRGA